MNHLKVPDQNENNDSNPAKILNTFDHRVNLQVFLNNAC